MVVYRKKLRCQGEDAGLASNLYINNNGYKDSLLLLHPWWLLAK